MNPSSAGWIDKFGHLTASHLTTYTDMDHLYHGIKKTGFVYGINLKVPPFIKSEHTLSEDEKAKINLLNALYFTFLLERNETDFKVFLTAVFQFYTDLKMDHMSLLGKLLTGTKTSAKLEKLIDSRIYLEDNLISKTFNSVITNTLLFIDVITFKEYLRKTTDIRSYAQRLENLAINVTYEALNSKEKNKNDERLQQVFASSLTFVDDNIEHYDGSYRDKLKNDPISWENRFLLDIACLTVWEDKSLEYKESDFVYTLGMEMGFNAKDIALVLDEVSYFFSKNAKDVPFLKQDNLAVQFYESMSKIVNKLILRNSKRLQKELAQSGELVMLLSKSTVRDLSSMEKKKVQNHLIDIFKSIPSLAIFLLPGGAVLLPIFIKLIPKLLPSSFDENRLENSNESA
ncbi:MAG: LETM1-related biofilm-associated protein [Flavobacteriaceae bacterium]